MDHDIRRLPFWLFGREAFPAGLAEELFEVCFCIVEGRIPGLTESAEGKLQGKVRTGTDLEPSDMEECGGT